MTRSRSQESTVAVGSSPDGEVLKYAYDRGGLVQAAHGERPATRHEAAQAETYLGKLLYDENPDRE